MIVAHDQIETLVDQLSPRFRSHHAELDIFVDRIVVAITIYDKCEANSTSSQEFQCSVHGRALLRLTSLFQYGSETKTLGDNRHSRNIFVIALLFFWNCKRIHKGSKWRSFCWALKLMSTTKFNVQFTEEHFCDSHLFFRMAARPKHLAIFDTLEETFSLLLFCSFEIVNEFTKEANGVHFVENWNWWVRQSL